MDACDLKGAVCIYLVEANVNGVTRSICLTLHRNRSEPEPGASTEPEASSHTHAHPRHMHTPIPPPPSRKTLQGDRRRSPYSLPIADSGQWNCTSKQKGNVVWQFALGIKISAVRPHGGKIYIYIYTHTNIYIYIYV